MGETSAFIRKRRPRRRVWGIALAAVLLAAMPAVMFLLVRQQAGLAEERRLAAAARRMATALEHGFLKMELLLRGAAGLLRASREVEEQEWSAYVRVVLGDTLVHSVAMGWFDRPAHGGPPRLRLMHPGSRQQEVEQHLPRILAAVAPEGGAQAVVLPGAAGAGASLILGAAIPGQDGVVFLLLPTAQLIDAIEPQAQDAGAIALYAGPVLGDPIAALGQPSRRLPPVDVASHLAGVDWTLRAHAGPAAGWTAWLPWLTAAASCAVGGLCLLVMLQYAQRQERVRRLAERMTADLRATKDRLEQALAKSEDAARAKAEFLAVMSHELRTPLNGVIGMTSLLIESDLDAQSRDFAETARACATGLLSVIDDILDYSRLEAGKIAIENVEFDIRDLVEDAVQIVAERAQTKGLELSAEVHPALRGLVVGDPARIRQVLLNLLSNAIKFTPHGAVSVVATPAGGDGPLPRVCFAVADSGIGIAPEHLPRLFEPFTQADGTISRRFGGSGLGLAISKRLVAAMSGSMDAESTPGSGSIFRFTLALAAGDQTGGSEPLPALAGRRILVIDRHATSRRAVGSLLAVWGAVPTMCATVAEAAAVAGPEAAILDVAGAEDELAGRVAELRRLLRLPALPIVALTNYAYRGRSDIPFVSQTSKPVRRRHLLDALLVVLARRPVDLGA